MKSFKVPYVEVVVARMSSESALTRMTDSTPKNLGQTSRWYWMDQLTPIYQMKDLLLGVSTTCRRDSLEPEHEVVNMFGGLETITKESKILIYFHKKVHFKLHSLICGLKIIHTVM